jgi:hypothetical protein
MGKSYERDGVFGKYIEHFDDDGNKVGESHERTGYFGKYTDHTDSAGNKIGESHSRDGFFDTYLAHHDTSGSKTGESHDRVGFLDNYKDHTDSSGRKTGESRKREGLFGEYMEHLGTGYRGSESKAPDTTSRQRTPAAHAGSNGDAALSTSYSSGSSASTSAGSSSERVPLIGSRLAGAGAVLLGWLMVHAATTWSFVWWLGAAVILGGTVSLIPVVGEIAVAAFVGWILGIWVAKSVSVIIHYLREHPY